MAGSHTPTHRLIPHGQLAGQACISVNSVAPELLSGSGQHGTILQDWTTEERWAETLGLTLAIFCESNVILEEEASSWMWWPTPNPCYLVG